MRPFVLCFLCAWATAAYGQRIDPVAQVTHEIHELAQQEPALFGCETRLRLADAIRKRDPKLADRLLQETVQQLSSLRSETIAGMIGPRAVALALLVKPEEAEYVARALPFHLRPAAYNTIVGQWLGMNRKKAEEILISALESGAFGMDAALETLAILSREDPAHAGELFAKILTAFPASSARERDIFHLLDCTRLIVLTNRALAAQAVDLALSIADSKAFEQRAAASIPATFKIDGAPFTTRTAREAVLYRAGALLKAYAPDLYERNAEKLESVAKGLGKVTAANVESATERQMPLYDAAKSKIAGFWPGKFNDAGKQLTGMRFDDALAAAEAEPETGARSLLLFGLSFRSDGTEPQRRRAQRSFVSAVREVTPVRERLDRLTVFLWRADMAGADPEAAAAAIGEFARAAGPFCRCEIREETPDCEPGASYSPCLLLYNLVASWKDPGLAAVASRADPILKSRVLLITLGRLLREGTPAVHEISQ